jgi:hypothetical protein
MRLNNTRVSFTINKMDFLVDGDRRYLPLENGYFTLALNVCRIRWSLPPHPVAYAALADLL